MAETLKPVLIGDPNPERFKWLKNILEEEYGVDSVQVKTFDELQKLIEESNNSREQAEKSSKPQEKKVKNDWSLIFIADDLPPVHTRKSSPERVKTYFTILDLLNKWGDFITVLIVTQDIPIDWRGITPPTRSISISDPPEMEERQSIIKELEGLGGFKHVPETEYGITWDKDDRILREQIRSLSDRRNLQDGESHLVRLINRCLDGSKVKKVEIKKLGQGKSGARVFRLCVKTRLVGTTETGNQEFVLKLCQAGDVWKLESEVHGHTLGSLGLGYPGYKEHTPKLNNVYLPSGGLENLKEKHLSNLYIARSAHWYAVYYDFLGGNRFGEFVDLETALIASESELEEKLAILGFAVKAAKGNRVRAGRAYILETILKWLCENWYSNLETGYIHRREMIVWDMGDAPEQKYISMPPYKLTGRSKGWIQSFLTSQEAEMGERFFTDWVNHRDKVFRLVSDDPPMATQLGRLGEPLSVVLSQVHGDLNVSNILLWLKHKHPFLIDFPFYQEAGHSLQDFARLEVEIKFALMDRQKDSPERRLKAFEYTYSQMQIWQEMEDRLLDKWDQKASRWQSKGYSANVQLCHELVQLVRRKAQDVQQNDQCTGPPAGDFLVEYWPALLYHTVCAIGYPSLSVFKRLLAVYSAGSILTKLNCFSDLN